VSLVNTLAMATAGRRDSLRLLIRVGATARQLLSMTGWQTFMLSVIGIGLGVATGRIRPGDNKGSHRLLGTLRARGIRGGTVDLKVFPA
jgi:hypothetical protein